MHGAIAFGVGLAVAASGGAGPGEPAAQPTVRKRVPAASRAGRPGLLVFSLKSWEGEYATSDIPHGVAVSPNRNALYTIRGDGTGLRRLDLGGQDAQNPHVSADGRWIYYQTNDNPSGHWHIYRCRLDGSGKECLTEKHKLGVDSFGFELAPNGSRLVFVSNDGTTGRVAVMDPDGSNARILAPDIGYHYMASLSPDGQRVVFSHTADGYRMKLMDLGGHILACLTPDHPDSYCGYFTPDGRTILFHRADGDLYRVAADGTNLKRLTHDNSSFTRMMLTKEDQHPSSDPPDLSPDGTRVAYVVHVDYSNRVPSSVPAGSEGSLGQVQVMNLDGTGKRQITHLPGRCGRVRWSPDGTRIAFVSFVRESRPQLFVLSANGGEPKQITDLDGAVYTLNWSPK